MALKKYDLYQDENGDWVSKARGGKRASVKEETKVEAVKKMAEIAKNQGNTSVVIRKKDGTIQEERTYPRSSDPTSSKG